MENDYPCMVCGSYEVDIDHPLNMATCSAACLDVLMENSWVVI